MRNLKTYFLAAVLAMLAPMVFAQAPGSLWDVALVTLGNKAVSVSPNLAADDTSAALLVRGIRSGVSFDYGTTTADSLSFYTDAAPGSVLDVTINVGAVCGATLGKLLVTDADCNTLGEVVDQINKSANWRAVILDGRRADALATDELLTQVVLNATKPEGTVLAWDTNVRLIGTRALVPAGFRSMVGYLNPVSFELKAQPFNGYRTIVFKLNQVSAFTTATSLEVHGVLTTYPRVQTAGVGNETDSLYFSELTAATTVFKTFDFTAGFALVGGMNEKLLVVITGASAYASEKLYGYAIFYEYPR